MGTRSSIGVMHGDKIKAVYCHWDGYLSHNGRILYEHYTSSRANQLVALGNLSSLGERVVPAESQVHTFDNKQKGVCVFYGRDRGEHGQEFQVYHSLAEWADSVDYEFLYVMKDNVWYVSTDGLTLEPLEDALALDEAHNGN
jgi:hypothetical protein